MRLQLSPQQQAYFWGAIFRSPSWVIRDERILAAGSVHPCYELRSGGFRVVLDPSQANKQ